MFTKNLNLQQECLLTSDTTYPQKTTKHFTLHCLRAIHLIVSQCDVSNMNTFQIRVAKYWNKIPDDVKLSADVDKFKIKLENYKKERFEVKGNHWELSDGIVDRRV